MESIRSLFRWLPLVPVLLLLVASFVGLLLLVPSEHASQVKEGFFYLVGRVTSQAGVARRLGIVYRSLTLVA